MLLSAVWVGVMIRDKTKEGRSYAFFQCNCNSAPPPRVRSRATGACSLTLISLQEGQEDEHVDESREEGAGELREDVGQAVLGGELLAPDEAHGHGDGRVQVRVGDGGRGVNAEGEREAPQDGAFCVIYLV